MIRTILIGVFSLCISGLKAQTHLDTAVNFVVTDINGGEHNLFDYLDQGKHVLIDFFYTTCGPCIGLLPELHWAMESYGCNQGDLIMLSIDYNDSNDDVLQFQSDYGTLIPAISGIDGGGNQIIEDYGIYAFPTLILIAPDHSVLNQDIFPINQSNLQTAIELQAGIAPNVQPCGAVTSSFHIDSPLPTFSLFPNPTSTSCTLSHAIEPGNPVEYIITNISGQISQQGNITYQEESILFPNLAPGFYFFTLYSKGQVQGSTPLVIH